MKQFEEAAQAAIESIPEDFEPYLENTVFLIEESSPDGLMGLYEGAGALHAGEGLPERITLYKESHERSASTMRELIDEVRRTILHEVGHHFGMEEDDLPYQCSVQKARSQRMRGSPRPISAAVTSPTQMSWSPAVWT